MHPRWVQIALKHTAVDDVGRATMTCAPVGSFADTASPTVMLSSGTSIAFASVEEVDLADGAPPPVPAPQAASATAPAPTAPAVRTERRDTGDSMLMMASR